MGFTGVVMAAGEGKRMQSRIPKPLHRICGREMVRYPVRLLQLAGAERVMVVVSPDNHDAIRAVLGDEVEYALQEVPNGTGGAVIACCELLKGAAEQVLVIGADTVLVTLESILDLLESHSASDASMTVLTAPNEGLPDFGRVVLSKGRVTRIVEAAEAAGTGDDSAPLVNAGVYCFRADWLWETIEKIPPRPSGESYLTDLAEIGAQGGAGASAVLVGDLEEVFGVNNRSQLAIVEGVMRDRIRERWLQEGVSMTDPGSVYIDADVSLGMDTIILPNTMLTGRTAVGENCEIGPNSVVRDSVIGNNCRVTSSALEEATMEDHTDVGPFSHLRPGAYLETGVHIGNYVEVKESRFKAGAVMGHFGYAGDATIGARVNVGAGMITCNYDGKDKHRTVVEDDAFIGCDTMLVAPVTIGEGSVTGAGAVVTKDVPPARLVVGVPATIRRILK
jgi:bifunctional UDP-N-acetylglucosamine pyrophosphorylase/glucosamine-1-phosphate N-acetyltransferase